MDLQELVNTGVLSAPELTATINNLPKTPTRIAEMNLFQEQGLVGTDIVPVGIKDQKLVLVPNVPRGAPAQPKRLKPANMTLFKTGHLPQRSTIMADTLLNAFNQADPSQAGIEAVVAAHLAVHRRDNDYTIEYQRLGALKGKILDADGSEIYDLYDEFGVSQITLQMALGNKDTKVLAKVLAIKRAIEKELGGVPYTGIHVFVGAGFFDGLTTHDQTQKAYDRWQDGAALRDDNRTDFKFGGVTFEEVSGGFGETPIVPEDEGLAFPVGVPDQFITRFAPGDYLEAVKGVGLPYYSKSEPLRMNKGIDLESQSNPLNLNTRPRTSIKLKL
ncbi:major capsid protein [Pseudoxanthomonas winnipegensis]|uniref:Major capsid protein n=1 Tax=Pseudoxanthomonas winnipegensis TaxID=2480810 RepID=A0A4Q8M5Z6_9GAMM|nr:major capsid protein [Pseudoxanthomonas winnipegensis]TAA42473.1 major capsid protein [Pseudoxanthomonas winnipegensis]